jgi:hypothetical protein
MTSIFDNRTFTIATQHKKEEVLAPILRQHFNAHVLPTKHFNTDLLGTFTGEIERTEIPISTARKKCLLAMERFNLDLCIASEGSFGPHLTIPFAAADEEILYLIDKTNGIEIHVHHVSTRTNFNGAEISNLNDLHEFAQRCKFPSHALILRDKRNNSEFIKKGITTWDTLIHEFNQHKGKYGSVFIETDMRAHLNPTRMTVIEETAEKLIASMRSLCPECNTPGFTVKSHIQGLPCSMCYSPTRSTLYHVYACQRCEYSEQKKFPHQKQTEDPMYCDVCNP